MKTSQMTFPAVALMAAVMTAPAFAIEMQPGTYALPDGQAKVSATLAVTPDTGLRRMLDIAMTPLGGAVPVTRYQTELSKQLHVIAVSSDLRTFVHEHGDRPGSGGHFHVPVAFPYGGLWHVYADGVPQGLGQQVMRFDLVLGGQPAGTQPALSQLTGTHSADGRYSIKFDAFDLKAGQESQLSLHLLRDDKPAPDVVPYLGVAAHAVFIDGSDLTYVHVHAAPTKAPGAGGTGAAMAHDMTGMQSVPGVAASGPASTNGDMEGMGAPLPAGSKVQSELTMHVKAPKAGTYVLWIQFNGGGKVRTVQFVVKVG